MNRAEYMEALKKALEPFSEEVKSEIISDYEEHFEMGAANGKTEEQIIEELGSIEELVFELKNLTSENKEDSEMKFNKEDIEKSANEVVKGFADFLGFVAGSAVKGAEKFSNGFSENAGDFAENFANGFESIADKVVKKSTEFAKEVEASYKANRSAEEAAEAEGAAEEAEAPEKTEGETVSEDGTEENAQEADPVLKDYDRLVIETDCGDVKIGPSGDGELHFDYENEGSANQQLAYRFVYRQEGTTVYAVAKKLINVSNFFSNIACPEINLSVCVPEAVKTVEIHTMSGDVEIKRVGIDTVTVNTMSGDVVYEESGSKNLKVATMSGDVDLSIPGSTVTAVNTMSGDVKANVYNSDGYTLSVKSASGDINVKCGSTEYNAARSGNYAFGAGQTKLTIASLSGDVTVAG